jgi:isoleucyl-tRNA synthetase
MDYSKTLNLPNTKFPMRANLPQREPEIAGYWDEINVYQLVQAKNAGRPKFILHDGPPYANGHIHLGHVLNKVLKDMIVKFKAMDGYDAPYVPGWDTHGLPIEQQAIKQLGIRHSELDPVEFRRRCRDYALKFVAIQREEFKRLGVRGDWDNPYLTLQPHFEARQIEVFGEMARRGYIYKGLKAVYWCSSCETALAEAEVEYAEKESPSIYVAFPVVDGRGRLNTPGTAIVIWTTTPWTIPSNVAICLHPEFTYVLLKSGDQRYLVARDLADSFRRVLGDSEAEVEREYRGEELGGVVCRHPFIDRDSVVVLDSYVTLEQGTGCVHTAPGHGTEDFALSQRYDLPVISPIDGKGYFTGEADDLEGLFYLEANAAVIQKLTDCNALVGHSKIRHQYPHCWRCKHQVFFRATEQWFASINDFRHQLLEAIDRVRWIPEWGRERIHGMVAGRGDWCISRQRLWGVPIPIFYCLACEREVITEGTIEHLQELFRIHGADVWYARDVEGLLPPGLECPHCGRSGGFTKELDTMDVWFDSGSSHWGVLAQPDYWPDLHWPAEMYLEGSDQHRGWFNSSLTTAVAVTGEPPYRAVLTHGFVVDEHGRKMSKSLGNVVDPAGVLKELGADILRLWVCSADYRGDLAVSPGILKQMSEAYRKIRNTLRFLLGNLGDFDPERDTVDYSELTELDRYALLKMHRVTGRVLRAYRNYEYHPVYHTIYNYCVADLSSFYLNVIKDRLYCESAGAVTRRAAQTVLYAVLDALVRLLAPVLTFTTEEVWRHFPGNGKKPPSVQLLEMPEPNPEYLDDELEQRWERLLEVRQDILRVLESARQEKLIRDSLEAEVVLFAGEELLGFLRENEAQLRMIFVTSSVRLVPVAEGVPDDVVTGAVPELRVSVRRASGAKCARCWTYADTGVHPEHPDLCRRCAAKF